MGYREIDRQNNS